MPNLEITNSDIKGKETVDIPHDTTKDGKGDLLSNPYLGNKIKEEPISGSGELTASDMPNVLKRLLIALMGQVYVNGKLTFNGWATIAVVTLYILGEIFVF
jgi:hypothetical protein